MQCPYCSSDLVYVDWYGQLVHGEHYWIPNSWQKNGDIYRCLNSDGFESEEDKCCESFCFGGIFHVDTKNHLFEGRP